MEEEKPFNSRKGLLIICLLKGLAYLPFGVLYLMSDLICIIVQHVIKYRRKTIRNNLLRAFPEKNESERLQLETRYYHHFCDMIVENIKLLHMSDNDICERAVFTNIDKVYDMLTDERPIVLFMGHLGNWEWTQSLQLFVSDQLKLATLYKPSKSDTTNYIINTIRSRFAEVEKIPSRQALRKLLRYNSEGKKFLVAFIADQRISSRNNWLCFFNERTTFYTGGEDLARHINAHPMYLDISKPTRGHYVMQLKPLDAQPYADQRYPLTHAFMAQLEENIRRQPELWLWSHNRWKNNHLLVD